MTQEEKELLLKDLCTRLPYNVVINCTEEDDEKTNFDCFLAPDMIKDIKSETAYWIIKPYLRPMSSMTDEEKVEIQDLYHQNTQEVFKDPSEIRGYRFYDISVVDWLNAHHFDYRGLIDKELALEATKEMYKD